MEKPPGGGVEAQQPRPTLFLWPRLPSWEETWSLIPEKGLPEDDPDVVVKGGEPLSAHPRDPQYAIPTLQGIMPLANPLPSISSQAGCTGNPGV
jgi:hypothetical protein